MSPFKAVQRSQTLSFTDCDFVNENHSNVLCFDLKFQLFTTYRLLNFFGVEMRVVRQRRSFGNVKPQQKASPLFEKFSLYSLIF
jgi:hypothetical protein